MAGEDSLMYRDKRSHGLSVEFVGRGGEAGVRTDLPLDSYSTKRYIKHLPYFGGLQHA